MTAAKEKLFASGAVSKELAECRDHPDWMENKRKRVVVKSKKKRAEKYTQIQRRYEQWSECYDRSD